MSEHTELPWKIEIRQNNIAILSGDKVVALMCVKPDNDHLYKPIVVEANAEYIVLACNSHKDLAERLFNNDKYAGGHGKMCHLLHYAASDPRGVCDCGFEELRAAIAKAKPK